MGGIKILLVRVLYFMGNLCSFVVWFLRQLKNENFRKYVDSEQKGTLVILGNGPSLKKNANELKLEKDCLFCSVNHAAKTDIFREIRPSMYVLADPLFFYNCTEKELETINALNNIDWAIDVFVPYTAYKGAKNIFTNKAIRLVPFHTNTVRSFELVKYKLYQMGLSMPPCSNVLIAAIYIGVLAGFSRIIVYGLDFSWIREMVVDEHNVVCRSDEHYYEESSKQRPWLDSNGQPFTVSGILRILANGIDSFREVAMFAQQNKCLIINRNKASFVDSFKKE